MRRTAGTIIRFLKTLLYLGIREHKRRTRFLSNDFFFIFFVSRLIHIYSLLECRTFYRGIQSQNGTIIIMCLLYFKTLRRRVSIPVLIFTPMCRENNQVPSSTERREAVKRVLGKQLSMKNRMKHEQ